MAGKATAAAMRAAEALFGKESPGFSAEWLEKRAAVIDRETGLSAAPDMERALQDAEAGLKFAIAVLAQRGGCNCSRLDGIGVDDFVCTPHKALASVRAALAKVSA